MGKRVSELKDALINLFVSTFLIVLLAMVLATCSFLAWLGFPISFEIPLLIVIFAFGALMLIFLS